MNIWYIHHYATPPSCGLPGRPYNLELNLKKLGHEVIVICASFHHLRQSPASEDNLHKCCNYDGVVYYHLPARSYNGNGLGRILNMLDFAGAMKSLSQKIGEGELKRPDILIPSCAPSFVFSPSYRLAKEYGAKLIYEVRDIWPLSIVELLNVSSVHPLVLWLKWIEKKAYQKSDAVVSLLSNALEHMSIVGLANDKFHFIPNGINRKEWESPAAVLPMEYQKVFRRLKDQGKLIVIYAGAHGPPNVLDQILDLAKLNQNKDKPYHFVLIGDGVEKEKLVKRAQEAANHFVTFLPKISKPQVIEALKLADVCFLGWQKRKIYKFGISPNKLGDYFMSAKPVLHSIEIANDPVQAAGAGVSVEPYNPCSLEEALQRFCAMTGEERTTMGQNGRQYALKNLDWELLGKKYADICESLRSESGVLNDKAIF